MEVAEAGGLLVGFGGAVVVAVAVTVAVAVAVGVGVAVAALVVAGAVEDYGHVAVFALFVDAVELGEHGAFEQAGADDEEGAVGVAVDDLGVGHYFDGWTVDEYVVVAGLELVDELAEAGRFEELGGVGGYGAHGEH